MPKLYSDTYVENKCTTTYFSKPQISIFETQIKLTI